MLIRFPDRGRWGGLLLIFLVALGIRLVHLDWGLPDRFEEATSLQKAWEFWNWEEGAPDFNPHFFNYPTFYFYMQYGLQVMTKLIGSITGSLPDGDSFRAAWYIDPGMFLYRGRLLSALLGALTAALVFLIGGRLGGRRVAILAGLLVALHPVHVAKSRFVEVDVPMTFFATIALLLLFRFLRSGAKKELLFAGLSLGLAASTKYPAALFLILIPVAAWIHGGRFPIQTVIASGLLAGIFFLLGSPYALLDWDSFRRGFEFESLHMRVGHFGGSGGGFAGAVSVFTSGFGVFFILAALAGFVLAFKRGGTFYRLLLPVPVAVFTLLALSKVQSPHYPLPALPSLALLAAWALDQASERAGNRSRSIFVVLSILVLAQPAWRSASETVRLGGEDSRTAARRWIEANVDDGAMILLEPHGPQLRSQRDLQRHIEKPEFRAIRETLLDGLAGKPAYKIATIPSFSIELRRADRYYRPEVYAWFDYFLSSSFIRERYEADPKLYPMQTIFYEAIEKNYRVMQIIEPENGRGPTITIYRRRNSPEAFPNLRLDRAGSGDETFLSFIRHVAYLYQWAGLTGPSVELYRALVALQPDDPKTLAQMGTMLGDREGPASGIPLLERSVALAPANRSTMMNLGVLYCQNGQVRDGIRLFEELLRKNPGDAEIHGNLASAWLSLGDEPQAARHFRLFLENAPDHPRAAEIRRALLSLRTER